LSHALLQFLRPSGIAEAILFHEPVISRHNLAKQGHQLVLCDISIST
jgi:hypothetical protein